LNDDGTTPTDNPFFDAGAAMKTEAGANIQKIFAYGVRNSFGLAFDPKSGNLWDEENGDDSFDELNRIEAGANLGWIQFMGPADRISDFKAIESSLGAADLQQKRWPPANIADNPTDALSRLFMLPGAKYRDPEFSWKFAIAPAAIGFVDGPALGPQYDGDLIVGATTPALQDGYLLGFNLTGNRQQVGVDDPRLEDRVADNAQKSDITESESLQFGSGFGVSTDIQTGLTATCSWCRFPTTRSTRSRPAVTSRFRNDWDRHLSVPFTAAAALIETLDSGRRPWLGTKPRPPPESRGLGLRMRSA
jgi:aldose sugar dehydrogenase